MSIVDLYTAGVQTEFSDFYKNSKKLSENQDKNVKEYLLVQKDYRTEAVKTPLSVRSILTGCPIGRL